MQGSDNITNPADILHIDSQDDKAYVKPEGSDALDKKSYQSSNTENAGKLPKYDFANPLLHITPASHRIVEYKVENDQLYQTKDESV